MLTVLQIISGRGPTGPAAAAINDIRALCAAGVRVLVACRQGAPELAQELSQAGLPDCDLFKILGSSRGLSGLLRTPAQVWRLNSIIQSHCVDLVHVHRAEEQVLASLALGSASRKKIIRTWHRDPRSSSRMTVKLMAENSAGSICVARDHAEALLRTGAPLVRFIHGAVDTSLFQPRSDAHPASSLVIGQLARWKLDSGADRGQHFMLDILAHLPASLPWRAILAGRGEQESALRHYAFETLKLPLDRVAFRSTQELSPTAFAGLLCSFDLGLVFKTGSDGTSRPALEMLASGVPLIAAPIPGLLELAEENKAVQIGPANTATAWASVLEKILSNPAQLHSLRTKVRQISETRHSFSARGAALKNFYQECLIQ